MRDILLIVHIVAAAAWLGGGAAQFVIMPRMLRAGGETAATWMHTVVQLGRIYSTPAAIVVLATGVGLVLDSPLYEFENLFVVIGVLMVLIGGGLGGGVYGPKGRAAAEAFGGGDVTLGNAVAATIRRAAVLEVALLVLTVAAMVYRWGA